MSELNCSSCQKEIPVGKYYELHDGKGKKGDYCSPCWTKEQVKYETEIKKGTLKVIEAERERERERAKWQLRPLSTRYWSELCWIWLR